MRALLMSLLVHQFLALRERFCVRYPHAWLVWEAGAWSVPDADSADMASTRLPAKELQDCLPAGDALCFELSRVTQARALRLGRASSNDIVVNDATVSRELLLLHPHQGDSWQVEALASPSPLLLDGEALIPGSRALLKPGAELRMGTVRWTFHDANGFVARIRALADKLSAL